MRKNVLVKIMALLVILALANNIYAAVTYVDASPSNTTLADGTALNITPTPSNPEDITSNSTWNHVINYWHYRTEVGNQGSVFASHADSNSPMLRTKLSGLIPGGNYDVFVYYWVAGQPTPTGNNTWDISTGLTAETVISYFWNQGTIIEQASYFSNEVVVVEGNRALYEIALGSVKADAGGEILVYVDDFPGNPSRTWYDGIGYILDSKAANPLPANAAENIAIDTALSWDAGTGVNVSLFQFYFSAANDPNLSDIEPVDVAVVSGGGSHSFVDNLERDAVYTWRIDQVLTDTTIVEGAVWSFETIPSFPIIVANPVTEIVWPGEAFVLTVDALNPFTMDATGLNYQWYFNGLPLADSNVPSYQVNNAQMADNGQYYCKVTVVSNAAMADSAVADVVVKGQLASWEFEDNMLDTVGNWNGAMYDDVNDPNFVVADPAYAAGFAGRAFDFVDSAASSVVIDGSQTALGLPYGITAVAWVKTDGLSNQWSTIIAKGLPGWRLISDSTGRFASFHIDVDLQAGGTAGASAQSSTLINDGQWHFVAGTFDGTVSRVYVNGKLEGSVAVAADSKIRQNNHNVWVGGRADSPANRNWKGQLDEVGIYNYALSSDDIAQMYFDYTGSRTCIYPPAMDFTGPQGVKDCVVDIYDFAHFANSWLETGLRPLP